MADEAAAQDGAKKGKSSGMMSSLIIGVVAVLAAAIIGLAVFNFVLRPMLTVEEEAPAQVGPDPISVESVSYEFPDEIVHVANEDPDLPDMILQYQVGFICDSLETQALITERLTYFKAKVAEYHRNRTRTELNDPYTQTTIRNAIKQEANVLLKRIAPEEEHKVLEVFHLKWAIIPT